MFSGKKLMILLCSETQGLGWLLDRLNSTQDLKPTHTKLNFSNTSLLKSSNSSPGKFLISEIKHRVWRFRGKMQC